MRNGIRLAGIAALAAACQTAALAQPATFTTLPSLGGPFGRGDALSGDGTTVVGTCSSSTNSLFGFRWRAETGTVALSPIETRGYSASFDGSVVVGMINNHANPGLRGFRWTSGGLQELGVLPGDELAHGFAYGVSGDGNTVVGSSGLRAVKWTSPAAEALPLLTTTTYSYAQAISRDGSTIVGGANDSSDIIAARWTSSGIQLLGTLPGHLTSVANAVSRDGSVAVGLSGASANYGTPTRATIWSSGSLLDLGTLPGAASSRALGVSGDGSVVVGLSGAPAYVGTELAFIWTASSGMRNLQEVLTASGANLSGWTLQAAVAISDDGRTLTGAAVNAAGYSSAWIATIPSPSAGVALVSGLLLVRRRRIA
jgi:uncharacterized membrane protein